MPKAPPAQLGPSEAPDLAPPPPEYLMMAAATMLEQTAAKQPMPGAKKEGKD